MKKRQGDRNIDKLRKLQAEKVKYEKERMTERVRHEDEKRALLRECGILEYKIKTQAKQITELLGEQKIADEGVRQLSAASDALLTSAVLAFGDGMENEKKLILPPVDVTYLIDTYTLSAHIDDVGQYVMQIRRKPKDSVKNGVEA